MKVEEAREGGREGGKEGGRRGRREAAREKVCLDRIEAEYERRSIMSAVEGSGETLDGKREGGRGGRMGGREGGWRGMHNAEEETRAGGRRTHLRDMGWGYLVSFGSLRVARSPLPGAPPLHIREGEGECAGCGQVHRRATDRDDRGGRQACVRSGKDLRWSGKCGVDAVRAGSNLSPGGGRGPRLKRSQARD